MARGLRSMAEVKIQCIMWEEIEVYQVSKTVHITYRQKRFFKKHLKNWYKNIEIKVFIPNKKKKKIHFNWTEKKLSSQIKKYCKNIDITLCNIVESLGKQFLTSCDSCQKCRPNIANFSLARKILGFGAGVKIYRFDKAAGCRSVNSSVMDSVNRLGGSSSNNSIFNRNRV